MKLVALGLTHYYHINHGELLDCIQVLLDGWMDGFHFFSHYVPMCFNSEVFKKEMLIRECQ